ncbi:unnamed protein product [Closterium sp. NIES-64]|nr:unnamed protein product [Closterium sp. NIES-64]
MHTTCHLGFAATHFPTLLPCPPPSPPLPSPPLPSPPVPSRPLPSPPANTERRKVAHNGEQWPVDAHDLPSLLLSVLMPPYPCPAEERVGAWGDGGKWVCMLPTAIQENPIVYRKHAMPSLPIRFPTLHPSSPLFPPLPPSSHHSLSPPLPPPSPPLHHPPPTSSLVHASVGSNEQYDFEQAMGAALHTKPFTFDPFLSANATAHMLALPFLHFHQIAIAGAASLEAFRAKNPGITFMTLQGAMERLEHSYVDVLKMDCEGCEEEFIMGLKRETDEFLEKRRAEGGALTKEEKAGKRRGRGNAKLVVNGGNLPFGQLLVEFHYMHKPQQPPYLNGMRGMGYRMLHVEPAFHITHLAFLPVPQHA